MGKMEIRKKEAKNKCIERNKKMKTKNEESKQDEKMQKSIYLENKIK